MEEKSALRSIKRLTAARPSTATNFLPIFYPQFITVQSFCWFCFLLAVAAELTLHVSCVAAPVSGDQPAVLHLAGDAFVPGELRGSDDPKVLRWQSPLFTRPFDFILDAVRGVHYPLPSTPPKPAGEYCFELAAGDVLFGSMVGLTDEQVELDVARFGRLRVRRDSIRQFYRWQGADLIYLGPYGLAGWKELADTKHWREEAGQPLTDQPGATLFGDLGIPARAVIELELSWKAGADFTLALGVNDNAKSISRAFCFEVWTGYLVAMRETEREADTAIVQDVGSSAGRTHLVMYLDQEQGRLLVFKPEGTAVADLKISPKKPQVFGGVQLTNKGGGVRLERLRVSRWNGVPPGDVQADKARLHRTDGSIVYGQLTAVNADAKQFTVRDGDTVTNVPADQIAGIFLPPPLDQSPRAFRAVYQDGTQLSGELTRVDDDQLHLKAPGILEPLRLPLSGIRSLVVLTQSDSKPPPLSESPAGRLETDGLRLPGRLTSGREQPDASCLVWQPDHSSTASPLRPGVAGRIIYREPPPPPKPNPQPPQPQQVGVAVRVLGTPPANPARPPAPAARRSLHLRSGDTIPCEVSKIDESGITFKTPISDATFVAHDKVKAVELIFVNEPPKLNKTKRERLLTLPRILTDSPPTQLIRSKDGDFLRGRVIALDDKVLRVEVHLEEKEIPRDRISQIIWLHADELTESAAPGTAAGPAATATRVQTLRNDGNRLTFVAERLADKTLSGTSEVLGTCHADVTQVDQLLIGSAIEKAAADLPYHRWKLHRATEPKYVQAQNADSPNSTARIPGTESPLVGQPAPDFTLELLGGDKFHLASSKGKIVILDFWATWCGPCLQAMPQVEKVVAEFDEHVQLIAVNLEESGDQITSTLERHKLKVTAALDRDGVVAAKYSVTAIPQTVVIDRDGNIARLFVGGGSNFADQLREAIQSLVPASGRQ